jgi:hypothetical protein
VADECNIALLEEGNHIRLVAGNHAG